MLTLVLTIVLTIVLTACPCRSIRYLCPSQDGIQPTVSSYKALLTACLHTGHRSRAENVFQHLLNESDVQPDVGCYELMLRLYIQEGLLEEALAVGSRAHSQGLGSVEGYAMLMDALALRRETSSVLGVLRMAQEAGYLTYVVHHTTGRARIMGHHVVRERVSLVYTDRYTCMAWAHDSVRVSAPAVVVVVVVVAIAPLILTLISPPFLPQPRQQEGPSRNLERMRTQR